MLNVATLPEIVQVQHVRDVRCFGESLLADHRAQIGTADLDTFDPAGDLTSWEGLSPEEQQEQLFFESVNTIERLGSHYVARLQSRWAAMAAAKRNLDIAAFIEPADMPF